ncbi:MAG: hypothetical protein JXA96_04160 [Sedimentisphaerales bacterium]|nr:hypothetical protein [Sedimentisphaerales bacterium]
MKAEQNTKPTEMENLKEIPKWMRKYVQNRMLTNLVLFIIYIVLFSGIYIPIYLDETFFKNDNVIAESICKIVSLSAIILLLYFSIPKWGLHKLWKWVDQRIYHEGNISLSEPTLMKTNKKIGKIVGRLFFICVIGSVFLYGYIPKEYMQPVSAVYCVPFMVFLYFWQRPKYSPLMLIWPILYTIHAILIVAGVPIVFPEESGLISLNTFIPIVGYGFLTFLIIFIYSRYALRKLKGLTHIKGEGSDGD